MGSQSGVPGTSTIGITWELVRNAASQPHPDRRIQKLQGWARGPASQTLRPGGREETRVCYTQKALPGPPSFPLLWEGVHDFRSKQVCVRGRPSSADRLLAARPGARSPHPQPAVAPPPPPAPGQGAGRWGFLAEHVCPACVWLQMNNVTRPLPTCLHCAPRSLEPADMSVYIPKECC